MDIKDYYKLLNVSRNATAEDIKKGYRQMALKYHPDRNPGNILEAEAIFKEINVAYEILSNDVKRWQYDRLIFLSNQQQNTFPGQERFATGRDPDSRMDIIQRIANMGAVGYGMSWGKGWNCGRRRGGQCRRKWMESND